MRRFLKTARPTDRLLILCLSLAACNAQPKGDPNQVIGSPCADCTIELHKTLVLGVDDSAASAGPRYPAQLRRLANGDYLMAPTYEPGTASIFDPGGRLKKVIGGFGRGPGEMKEVVGVTQWFGDSIAAIHDGNEISVFDASYQYRRLVSMQSASFLTNDVRTLGRSLLARRTGTSGGDDHELREFSADGVPLQSYGATSPYSMGRMFADFVQSGDTIWAATWKSYELDAFQHGNGERIATVERTVDWFPKDAPQNGGARPAVQHITAFTPGQIIVLTRRPRPGLKTPAPAGRGGAARAVRLSEHSDLQKEFEQVLEILDVKAHRPVASVVVSDMWLDGFVSNNEVFGYEEDERTGAVRLAIWKITVNHE